MLDAILSTLDEVTGGAVCQIKVHRGKITHITLINCGIKAFIANLTPNEIEWIYCQFMAQQKPDGKKVEWKSLSEPNQNGITGLMYFFCSFHGTFSKMGSCLAIKHFTQLIHSSFP